MDFTQAMAVMFNGGVVTVVNNAVWNGHHISYKDGDFIKEDGKSVSLSGWDIMNGDWRKVK